MTYKTRSIGTLAIAVIFLIVTFGFLLYGQGKDQYIDVILEGIASLLFLLLSLYFYQKGRKGRM